MTPAPNVEAVAWLERDECFDVALAQREGRVGNRGSGTFNFRDDSESETCRCYDAARWPHPASPATDIVAQAHRSDNPLYRTLMLG